MNTQAAVDDKSIETLRSQMNNLKKISYFHREYPEYFSASTIEWQLRNPDSTLSKLVVKVNKIRHLPEDKVLEAAAAGEL